MGRKEKEKGGLRSCLELQSVAAFVLRPAHQGTTISHPIHRPSIIGHPSHHDNNHLPLSLPTSNLTSLQLVSYYNCLFSQTHTHPPLKPSCRYNRVASPGSPCLKVRRARFRLPSPVLSVRRRHPPTATSQSAITTNRHDTDTAIARPLAVCHALIGLSPIIPCDRLRLATPLHEHLPRHRPITSIHLA